MSQFTFMSIVDEPVVPNILFLLLDAVNEPKEPVLSLLPPGAIEVFFISVSLSIVNKWTRT